MSYPYQEILRLRVENESLKALNAILIEQASEAKKHVETIYAINEKMTKEFDAILIELNNIRGNL